MKPLILLVLFCFSFQLSANDKVERYLEKYKHIAISEMDRTGIPASIKLAQALLESGWGESDLAKVAKNHFGIKCSSGWDGKSYYKKDDDHYDGKLVQSCFRAYEFPEQSFIDHSDFLSTKRYAFLFDYHSSDYTSWAKGLQKAGYATDPKYPQKLINIIEKYELYTYDEEAKREIVEVVNNEPNQNQTEIVQSERVENSTAEVQTTLIDSRVYVDVVTDLDKERMAEEAQVVEDVQKQEEVILVYAHNGTDVYLTEKRESLTSISERLDVDPSVLVKYNEWIHSENQMIDGKKRIYLEKKKINFAGHETHHRVSRGEKMQDISDLYGVDLEALYLKNRIPREAEPLAGELILLKGLMRFDKRPKYKTVYDKADTKTVFEQIEYLFEEENSGKDREK